MRFQSGHLHVYALLYFNISLNMCKDRLSFMKQCLPIIDIDFQNGHTIVLEMIYAHQILA